VGGVIGGGWIGWIGWGWRDDRSIDLSIDRYYYYYDVVVVCVRRRIRRT